MRVEEASREVGGSEVKGGKFSLTMRYVLVVGILLFVANTFLGVVVLNQSKSAMRVLISKNMLDVVNSAAGSLDGNALEALTEDDVDGPVFRDIENRLLVFQNNVNIHFIYAVKQVDDGRFVFTVDPDPVDPGAFGEEIVTTPGLVRAGQGIPSVDEQTAQDRWGNYYSAFSPVFNSREEVVGIVGVDFDAKWFDDQVRQYTITIALVTALSVTLGGVVIVLVTKRVRARFRELSQELEGLSGNVDQLMDEMAAYSDYRASDVQPDAAQTSDLDEISALGGKIQTMQTEMGLYLEYLHKQAYTDSLTHVGNSTAYHEAIHEIDSQIAQGTAGFGVAVFDMNGLKELNDTFGHECGDLFIQGTARALQQGMPGANTYRIGGDEFAVIANGANEAQMETGIVAVKEGIAAFNESVSYPVELSVSAGVACFVPGEDHSYQDTFARADHTMYGNKRAFYQALYQDGDDLREPRS